jgi:hypothetical protein
MAIGRSKGRRKGDSGRDPGGFVALPWSVLDSAAYGRLGHPARALLLEFARQFVRDNNGRLLASYAYLSKRGWKSADVITRAKRELLESGFIHETVKGQRPNKASWYAITWQALDHLPGYDIGAQVSFERGAYRRGSPLLDVTKLRGYDNRGLRPFHGVARPTIAPSSGVGAVVTAPSSGAVRQLSEAPSTPSPGNHLDMPSAVASQTTH